MCRVLIRGIIHLLEVCKRGPDSWKLPSKTGSGAQAEEVQLSIKGYMKMIDVHIYLSIYLSIYLYINVNI